MTMLNDAALATEFFSAMDVLAEAVGASEAEISAALETAADALRDGMLGPDHATFYRDALENCPQALQGLLSPVMSRAINFQPYKDGLLGIWMIPVVVSSNKNNAKLPERIRLSSRHMMSFTSSVLKHLELDMVTLGRSTDLGFVVNIPSLIHENAFKQASPRRLMVLPEQAISYIHQSMGQPPKLTIGSESNLIPVGHASLYFAPVVAYQPADTRNNCPQPSTTMARRLEQVLSESFKNLFGEEESSDYSFDISESAFPYSFALEIGQTSRIEAEYRAQMRAAHQILASQHISPQGVAACVAPYAVIDDQNQTESMCIGVSFVSRLSQKMIFNLELNPYTLALPEAVNLAWHTLKGIGVIHAEKLNIVTATLPCENCGHVPFLSPNPDVLCRHMHEAPASIN